MLLKSKVTEFQEIPQGQGMWWSPKHGWPDCLEQYACPPSDYDFSLPNMKFGRTAENLAQPNFIELGQEKRSCSVELHSVRELPLGKQKCLVSALLA